MPFLPAPLSVTAMTMATSPFLPLVMNCLTPLMHIAVARPCTAVVRRAEASEPTCGSVRQKAPSICALRQRREPLLFLLRVAVAHQDGVDRAVGDTDDGAGAAVAGGDFFQHQRQRQVVQVGAAEFLGHADAVGAQCRQALVRVLRESGAPCPSCAALGHSSRRAKARTASRTISWSWVSSMVLRRLWRSEQFQRHGRRFAAADAQAWRRRFSGRAPAAHGSASP